MHHVRDHVMKHYTLMWELIFYLMQYIQTPENTCLGSMTGNNWNNYNLIKNTQVYRCKKSVGQARTKTGLAEKI